jgi:DNA polymerase-4
MTTHREPEPGTARRRILHVDMDAYFASVELLSRPELCGKPVIVSGNPELRTVVTSCTYEAKALGVRSGMPLVQALKLAPGAAVVQGSFHRYRTYTGRVFKVLLSWTPRVDPVSIDEAFMDVTECCTDHVSLAHYIQKRILEQTGLWASIGAGSNRLLAKMASRKAKPRGVCLLRPDDILPLQVDRLWSVGPETAKHLRMFGIATIADLRNMPMHQLRAILGLHGQELYFMSRGIDTTPVRLFGEAETPLSIGHEHTFNVDVLRPGEYLPILALMCQKVARRARDKGFRGRVLTLKYRLRNLRRLSRRRKLSRPTDQDQTIFRAARELAEEAITSHIRLIGVSISDLEPASGAQMDMFPPDTVGLNLATDTVRHRYGEKSIFSGRVLSAFPVRERGAIFSRRNGKAVPE